ncbi:MAG: hypothetical protein MUF58_15125 [Arcicella sp.]|jgi:hypothetical protein|nr:hypothetical protein [Arcicella sp.]
METNTLPLEKELEPIFTKQLPSFPDNIKDLFVKIAPFLAIIGVVFGVLGVGITALLSPFAWFSGSLIYGIGMIFLLIMVVLEALSITPLFAQKMQGWRYMYYAQFVSVIYNLCMGSWISGIIGAFIGFWILFQIKEKYS